MFTSIASVPVIHLVKSGSAAEPIVTTVLPFSDNVTVYPFCLSPSASFVTVLRPLRMDSPFLSGRSWSRVLNSSFWRKFMSVLWFSLVISAVSVSPVLMVICPCLIVWSSWRIVGRVAISVDRGCHFFSAT